MKLSSPVWTLLAGAARYSVLANGQSGHETKGFAYGRDYHLGSTGPKYWFSFGDSYTETGFDSSGAIPNNANPIGNPAYPGLTAAGGENWVGYVTTKYNNSLLYTYNYAHGGATIDAALVDPQNAAIPTLTDQVNQFLNTVASKPASTPWTSADALFSIWIVINDIGSSFYLGGDRGAFADTLLDAEFALVQKLYKAGARNFLFANVPCIDRSPLVLARSPSSQSLEKSVIAEFNKKLAGKIDAFKMSNVAVKTWLWDTNAQFTTILDSPTKYGFKDATSVGPGSDIFWGSVYHPSTYAHKWFGQRVSQLVLSDIIWYSSAIIDTL